MSRLFSEVSTAQLVCNRDASTWLNLNRGNEGCRKYDVFSEPWEKGANLDVSQAYRQRGKTKQPFSTWEWLRYWCELSEWLLFSEAVTSKGRFMQSRRGVWEKWTGILICTGCHSNQVQSDTSINSLSSTKFTLVLHMSGAVFQLILQDKPIIFLISDLSPRCHRAADAGQNGFFSFCTSKISRVELAVS